MKSLSVSGFNKVTTRKSEYMIGGQVAGVALLKVLIGVSHIDTNATTSHIRKELSDLDLYLPQIGYDVTKLNEHVKRLIENLQARGESTYDLLVNLFKAYETVPDVKFKGYVETKKSDYEEGRGNIDANSLMLLCENKYKTMVLNQTWNAPSPKDEKIVALQAEVTKLQKAVKGGPSKCSTKDRDIKDGQPKKKRPDKPAWMIKAPEEGEPNKKTVNGKEYWWCPKHASFGRHEPDECEGKGVLSKQKVDATRKTKFANAMSSFAEDDDEEEEDEE